MRIFLNLLKWLAFLLLGLLLALGLIILYWYLRPNTAVVSPALPVESWDAVNDGWHNSNTDMIDWNGSFFLVHASAPYHFASQATHLVVLRSADARHWEKLTSFGSPGEDIRDPKFAIINGRLIVYALKNTDFTAEPYATSYTSTEDGKTWTPLQEVEPKGWLFWRPKSQDGKTWYVPAYWHEHGKSALLRSSDGIQWTMVSQIYEGDRNDETDIEFQPDGSLIATARLEFSEDYFGDPRGATLIATSQPPFKNWTVHTKSQVTRLDGPNLFSYQGQVFAVGRYQPDPGGPFIYQGSIFSRKRTSLFLVQPERLVYLSDLPSAGDTSYEGVVMHGDDLFISYYTSDINRDYAWILGMVSPSSIRIARVNLPALVRLAGMKSGASLLNCSPPRAAGVSPIMQAAPLANSAAVCSMH